MKKSWSLCCLLLLVSGLALTACGGSARVTPPANQPSSSPAAPSAGEWPTPDLAAIYPMGTPTPEALPTGYPEPALPAEGQGAAAALIELAKKDLAQRLAVAVDQISVVSAAYTDWPDSSLGCPKPGVAYAQVITPGYRIVLEQAQKQYDYHTNLTDLLALCEP